VPVCKAVAVLGVGELKAQLVPAALPERADEPMMEAQQPALVDQLPDEGQETDAGEYAPEPVGS